MTTKVKPNEIAIARLYDAPVKMVWEAWTDPEQVAKWWGPRGFTITTHSKDLRPGGHWTYTMHGPDGIDYPNKTMYLEVEDNVKLVYDHGGNDDRPPLFRVTVVFSEVDGKTLMDMKMALPTPEAAEEAKKFIKKAGGNSTWDRLAEYLEKETSGEDVFVINRTFNAPIEVVYKMWTSPDHFAKWLPPTGSTMKFLEADIRNGGQTFGVMHTGNSEPMYVLANYLELVPPNKVVYTQQFCDANKKVIRPIFEPNWPETMLTTVTLAEEDENQTRVTVRWEVYGDATDVEVQTFLAERGGMTQGWTGSFDKLDELLSSR